MNKKRKNQNLNRQKEKAIFVSEPHLTVEPHQYIPELDTELFARILEPITQNKQTSDDIPNDLVQSTLPEEQHIVEPVVQIEPPPHQEPVVRFGLKLSDLIDAKLQVFTMNGPITGHLSSAKSDYLSLIDATQTPTLIPYKNIEFLIVN